MEQENFPVCPVLVHAKRAIRRQFVPLVLTLTIFLPRHAYFARSNVRHAQERILNV